MKKDNFQWLMQWYQGNCDGDWEHGNGINIGTIDNPGWYLKISIGETNLSQKEFSVIDVNRSENDWIYCSVKNGIFEGFGGPFNLDDLVKTFRNWAKC